MCSPLIDNSDAASLCEMKSLLYCTNCIVTYAGILGPLLFYQNMKNLVFSFGVDFHLCLGIVSFKMESSTQ